MKKNVTSLYALITAGFWMSFCVCVAYAGQYLDHLGYQPSEYGTIMAIGSLTGALIAPLLGIISDKYNELTPLKLIIPFFAVELVSLVSMLIAFDRGTCMLTSIAFTLYICSSIPVNTINLKMCVDLECSGAGINYSLARGIGSFGFVIISTVLGLLMNVMPYTVLPWSGILLIVFEIPIHLLADKKLKALRAVNGVSEIVRGEQASSLPVFAKSNKKFCLMLLGTVLIFIAHNMDCNFLNKINDSLGGKEDTLGYLSAFTAIVEVPVMVFFIPVFGKVRESTLVRFSLIMFIAKMLAYALSPSIPVLFVARILQAPSYALYTAAIVPYVSKVIAPKDANKGQSLAFSMTTAGSVVANLIGGFLYEDLSVRSTLLIATGICVIGVIVALLGTQTVTAEKSQTVSGK